MEAGIIVQDEESGEISYRVGTLILPGEKLIGGYGEVFRKDRNHSFRIEVSFDEYAGKKRDGSLNSQWSKKPATMIRKVAIVQEMCIRDSTIEEYVKDIWHLEKVQVEL